MRCRTAVVAVAAAFCAAWSAGQTIVWDGGGDGINWTNLNNWNPNRLPTADDDVLIPAGAQQVRIATGTNVARTLTVNRSFRITGGVLTIGESARFNGAFELFSFGQLALNGNATFARSTTQSGGSITGTGDAIMEGGFSMESGTMTGPGRLIISAGHGAVLGSGNTGSTLGRLLENRGLVRTRGRDLMFSSGLINRAGGTIELYPGEGFSWSTPDAGTFLVNEGLMRPGVGMGVFVIAPTIQAEGSRCEGQIVFQRGGVFAGLIDTGEIIQIHGSAAWPVEIRPTARFVGGGALTLHAACTLSENAYQHTGRFNAGGVDGDLVLTAPIDPSSFLVEGPLRTDVDQSWSNFSTGPYGEVTVGGGRTLTLTGTFAGGRIRGPGRCVITPGATGSAFFLIDTDNHSQIGGIWVGASAVFRNHAGASITGWVLSDGAPGGRIVNEGVIQSPNVVIEADLTNLPGGIVEATAADGYVSITGPSRRQYGIFRSGGGPAAYVKFVPEESGDELVLDIGAAVQSPRLILRRSTLEPGADIDVATLEVLPQGSPVVLRSWHRFTALDVATSASGDAPRGVLRLEMPDATLPATRVSARGTLERNGPITVGSTLTFSGDLAPGGELIVPPWATLATTGVQDYTMIRRPVRVQGIWRLGSGAMRIDDSATIEPGATLECVPGTASLSGAGSVLNLGLVHVLSGSHPRFMLVLDQPADVVLESGGGMLVENVAQRSGDVLTGGRWWFQGNFGIQGLDIGVIGEGASVWLGAGTSGPGNLDLRLHRVDGRLTLAQGRDLRLVNVREQALDVAGVLSLSAGAKLSSPYPTRLAPSCRVESEWAGATEAQQGILTTTGTMSLAGTLAILPTAMPSCAQTYTPLSAALMTGELTGAELPEAEGTFYYGLHRDPAAVRAGYFPFADYNADGFVDSFDVLDYFGCFVGDSCPLGRGADVHRDGFLDFFDSDTWVHAFEAGGC